jgi:hypothetical protein
MIFIVEYTNEDCVGNQVLTLQIEAEDLEDAWNTVEASYPYLAVDQIYPQDSYDWELDAGEDFAAGY